MTLNLTTQAAQIAHYKAVRARIAAAAYKPRPKTVEKRVNIFFKPLWTFEKIRFDDHVVRFLYRSGGKPHVQWLRARCAELNVDIEEIYGKSKKRDVAFIRFRLMYEMKKKFPDISLPTIGRAFGGRDHATVINALKRWEAMRHEND